MKGLSLVLLAVALVATPPFAQTKGQQRNLPNR
jgi:hypothetical protein